MWKKNQKKTTKETGANKNFKKTKKIINDKNGKKKRYNRRRGGRILF